MRFFYWVIFRLFYLKMSQNKPHGFCNAIFSSTPMHYDKENTPPNKKIEPTASLTTFGPILSSSPSCRRDLFKYTSPTKNKNEKCDIETLLQDEQMSSNLVSKSNSLLQRQGSMPIMKTTAEEKLKPLTKCVSNPRLSGDKSQVTHFCTPRNIFSSKSSNVQNSKTPKRFFNDHSLSQTPDCFNTVHLETPRNKMDTGLEEQTVYEGETSNLTVGVRVRPLSYKEIHEQKVTSIVDVNGQTITVDCESSQHTFAYDHCFISHSDPYSPGHASQETVFNTMVLPLVQNALEGYNVCLFAYGQTGSGKSYSMMGTELYSSSDGNTDAGIIPRFCQEIFSHTYDNSDKNISVEISYFEIYNEKIHDLLISNNAGSKRAPLKVREHPVFGPYIVDLSQHVVQNYEDLKAWLKVGNSQRATAATGMNEKSSRSHSIFSIILTQGQSNNTKNNKSASDDSRRSKINLVDLAGSERLSHTCASGDRLREGVSINKSLLTLGKVIGFLAENTNNRKRGFVPYRESVLTWLLKESLGGNSRTAMLGTVSPANIHLEETLATLRYACQARAIVNRVCINEDPHDRLIRELKAEVQRLKGEREGHDKQMGLIPRRLMDSIEPATENEEIQNKQREINELKEQLKKMEEHLSTSQNTIENTGGQLTLYPEKDGDTFVNGQSISGRVKLKHGDRLVIGGSHYFKVCNPQEGNETTHTQPIDFEFAHQEILRIQEEKLRVELEESKQKAMKELENAKREVEMQLDSQKSSYEREIKKLGSSLEKQKMALEEMNQKKEELEREKALLTSEIELNNKLKKIQLEDSGVEISPYKSNFLQELEEILNETTADAETALTVKTSIEAMKTGGVSLHEIQLLVREAWERCREVGINYEFHLQQLVVDKDLQPVIRVRNRDHRLESLWQPMQFLDWIHRLRDHDIENSIKELQDIDLEWDAYEESEVVEDSLYVSSRISINLTPVKKQLNESLSQFSLDASMLEASMADQSVNTVLRKRQEDIQQCLIQMELAAKTLNKLCTQYESNEISSKVSKSLESIYEVIGDLTVTLERKYSQENSSNSVDSNTSSVNNTVIESSEADHTRSFDGRRFVPNSVSSPGKSLLRTCLFAKSDNAARSVRFNVN